MTANSDVFPFPSTLRRHYRTNAGQFLERPPAKGYETGSLTVPHLTLGGSSRGIG